MNQPDPPGTVVDVGRMDRWVTRFGPYREAIGESAIRAWLTQFAPAHQDTAARVLDAVNFYSNSRIGSAFRECLGTIPGWSANPSERVGRWRFTAFSPEAGDS